MTQLLDKKFKRAVSIIASLPPASSVQPSNNDKLILYGLYKQATVGDCSGPKPAFWDVVSKAKWESWVKLSGTASEHAKGEYISMLTRLLANHPEIPQTAGFISELTAEFDDGNSTSSGSSSSRDDESEVDESEENEIDQDGNGDDGNENFEDGDEGFNDDNIHYSEGGRSEVTEEVSIDSRSMSPEKTYDGRVPSLNSSAFREGLRTSKGGGSGGGRMSNLSESAFIQGGSFLTPVPPIAVAGSRPQSSQTGYRFPLAKQPDIAPSAMGVETPPHIPQKRAESSMTAISTTSSTEQIVTEVVTRLRDLEVQVAALGASRTGGMDGSVELGGSVSASGTGDVGKRIRFRSIWGLLWLLLKRSVLVSAVILAMLVMAIGKNGVRGALMVGRVIAEDRIDWAKDHGKRLLMSITSTTR